MRELYPAPEPSETPGPEASWVRDGDGEADQTLEENWLFRLRRERFRSRASGKAHAFYVIHLADAVNVIALTPDRQVILVRQFRAGSCRDSLETPGGLVDEGEDPLEAGARELLEETGYAGELAQLVGTVWSNSSILTSRSTTILIENARRVAEPRLDHGEEVAVELIPEGLIPRMIQDGRIDHSLVVCGLLWWLQSRFPGRLVKAGPPLGVKIGTVMKGVAAIAVFLGLLANLHNPTGALALVAILAFAAFLALSWPGLWKGLSGG